MGFDRRQDGDCNQYRVLIFALTSSGSAEIMKATMETSFNFQIYGICRFACSLLRQGMKQIIITLDTPEIQAVERTGEKSAITEVINLTVVF